MTRAAQEGREKLARLTALWRRHKTMLIVMQDHPDPDALASAAGLRVLANAVAGLQCTLAHGGVVGRAENRALAKYLNLNLHALDDIDAGRFDVVALVDTQPGAGNNSLSRDVVPDIVIDHHPRRGRTRACPFTDIRSRYGATSTVVYEYLVHAGVEPDVDLATALVYGIRSDTQDLGREAVQADIDAFLALYPKANKRMLGRIERERVPDAYFRLLARALAGAEVCGNAVVAGLGVTDNPDMIAEVADLFLRREDTAWVLCYGFYDGKALFSIRTSDPEEDAGSIARRLAGRKGSGGGHGAYAAGRVPLSGEGEKAERRAGKGIAARFRRLVHVSETGSEKLIT